MQRKEVTRLLHTKLNLFGNVFRLSDILTIRLHRDRKCRIPACPLSRGEYSRNHAGWQNSCLSEWSSLSDFKGNFRSWARELSKLSKSLVFAWQAWHLSLIHDLWDRCVFWITFFELYIDCCVCRKKGERNISVKHKVEGASTIVRLLPSNFAMLSTFPLSRFIRKSMTHNLLLRSWVISRWVALLQRARSGVGNIPVYSWYWKQHTQTHHRRTWLSLEDVPGAENWACTPVFRRPLNSTFNRCSNMPNYCNRSSTAQLYCLSPPWPCRARPPLRRSCLQAPRMPRSVLVLRGSVKNMTIKSLYSNSTSINRSTITISCINCLICWRTF